MKENSLYEGSTQFIAFTKPVNKNGSGTQNHSGATIKKPTVITNEITVMIQYFPVAVAEVIIV